MTIEVSIGEALDRLSILSIKMDKIKDEKKHENISKEYFRLIHPIDERMLIDPLYKDLKSIKTRMIKSKNKNKNYSVHRTENQKS